MAKDYESIIQSAGKKYNVDPALIRAVIQVETGGQRDPNTAVSSTGAVGAGQLMPDTARRLGVTDRTDPVQNINGAAKLLDQLLTSSNGNVELALTRYHGGYDTSRWGPKTQAYPGKVMGNIRQLPGVPEAAPTEQSQQSDDDIFSAFAGASAAPAGSDHLPQQNMTEDDIFKAFTYAPEAQSPANVAGSAQTVDNPPAGGGDQYALGTGGISNFIDALGHNAGNAVLGLGQTALHGLSAAERGLQGLVGGGEVLSEPTAALDRFIQNREANYQQNVPTNAASVAGAGVGQVLPFLAGGGGQQLLTQGGKLATTVADMLGAGAKTRAAANFAGQSGGSALLGTLAAGAQPVVTPGNFGQQKAEQAELGALVGGAVPGVTRAAGAAAQGVGNFIGGLVRPFTQRGQETIAANVLREAAGEAPLTYAPPSAIPGVESTLAESTGNPGVAALQRAMASRPGNEALSLRQTANQDARSAFAQGVTGSADDVANLQAARDVATLPMLRQAFANQQPVNVQPVVDAIDGVLNSPGGQREAIRNVIGKVRSTLDNVTTPVSSPILGANGQPVAEVTMSASPDALYQSVRKQIGDMLESQNPETRSNVKAVQQQLLQVRDALDSAIEQGAPGFAAFRQAYASQSQPISALQTLQDLKLLGADGTAPVTLAKVRQAVGKIESARANPNSRNLDTRAVSDDQYRALVSLRDDLLNQQRLNAGQNTVRGSTTAQNLATGAILDSQQPALVRMLLNGTGRSMTTGGALGALLGQAVGGPGGAAAGAAIGSQAGTAFGGALRSKSPEVEARVLDMLLNPAKAESILSAPGRNRFPLATSKDVNATAAALGGSESGRKSR